MAIWSPCDWAIMRMSLGNLSISARFLVVLLVGFIFQTGISVLSLIDLKDSLLQDRRAEVKHTLEIAYSTVEFYHDRFIKGLLSEDSARKAAADAVRAMHYDQSNYFFIWDLHGTCVAHGAQPNLEGRTFIDSEDARNNPVVSYMAKQLIAAASNEQKAGYTTYRIPKMGQTVPLEKIAFTRLFQPWGWSIGTGAYVDDIDELFRRRALFVALRTIVLIGLAGGITFVLGKDLSMALKRLSARVVGVATGELEGDVPDVTRLDEVGIMARALLLLRDTSREAAELRLDQLTGLPTRKLLMDRIGQARARSARSGNFSALMLVDVDKFKSINDTHGHDVGDMLLCEVAHRILACVREGDTVARLGGDEFVLVIADTGGTVEIAAARAEVVYRKILSVLNQPYQFGNIIFSNTASIGVTLVKGDDVSIEGLLKQADLAMYKSKRSGRNRGRFFDVDMEANLPDGAGLQAELLDAIANSERSRMCGKLSIK